MPRPLPPPIPNRRAVKMGATPAPTLSPRVFDRDALRTRRNRAAAMKGDYDFLHRWAMKEIAARLSMVRREFPHALQIGGRAALPDAKAAGVETLITCDMAENNLRSDGARVQGDEEFLPFANGSLDLVLGLMTLQGVNDLPGALVQIRRALKPDGLFMAAMMGGETLWQLRDALARAEVDITGGASPRVFPFADKQQMGALMQRAGFALPVVDSDLLTVTYDHIFKLMTDLRGMGETAAMAERPRGLTSRALFARAGEIYRDLHTGKDGKIEATFEIIFLSGWAPHEGQQKPLRPGSADHRLADVLRTQEKPC